MTYVVDLSEPILNFERGISDIEALEARTLTNWDIGRSEDGRLKLLGQVNGRASLTGNILIGIMPDLRHARTTIGWHMLDHGGAPFKVPRQYNAILRELKFFREVYRPDPPGADEPIGYI